LVKAHGKELTLAEIKQLVAEAAREHAPNIVIGAMKKVFEDPTMATALAESIDYDHIYEAPYPCSKEVLSVLCTKFKLGIIANQNFGAEDRLSRYGLREYISVIASSAEAGVSKPDRAIFQLALDKAGCRPHQAIMIGDRLDNDIKPAKALGMGTVWVRQGYHGLAMPRDESEKPDFTINSIDELPGILL
jgi:HAD superfamily hydrolase (TIGR01549 family)